MELDLDERPDFRVDAGALAFLLLEEGSKLFEHLLGQRREHKQSKEPKGELTPKNPQETILDLLQGSQRKKGNEILGLHPL